VESYIPPFYPPNADWEIEIGSYIIHHTRNVALCTSSLCFHVSSLSTHVPRQIRFATPTLAPTHSSSFQTMTVMVESMKIEEGDRAVKMETFDDILPHVGEASRYQWFLFILLLPFTFVYAFMYFVQFFIALVPAEHWCSIPELEFWNLTDYEK